MNSRIEAPEQAPETVDELERRVIASVTGALEVARLSRYSFGEHVAGADEITQWRALHAELVTLLAALRAERPRQIAAREEGLASGARAPLSVDDAFRAYELRVERVVILMRQIGATFRRAP